MELTNELIKTILLWIAAGALAVGSGAVFLALLGSEEDEKEPESRYTGPGRA